MLKKVPIHNPSESSCVQSKTNCCSMCKCPGKSIFYVCKSGGHIICNNCQHSALNLKSTKSTGDGSGRVPEEECAPPNKQEILFCHSGANRRDMSSGDHCRVAEAYKDMAIGNYEVIKTVLLPTTTSKECSKCEPVTMIIYKNEKFYDDYSNMPTDYISPAYNTTEKQTYEIVTRPIVCPIASCSKMVTIDSFSQHFNFDHSKVPRVVWNRSSPQELMLNCAALSQETKCVATFVISPRKRTNQTALRRITSQTDIHNLNKDQLLLLMGAKMETRPMKFAVVKRNSRDSINKRNTMINEIRQRNMQDKLTSINKSQSENKIPVQKHTKSDNDEIILLWLCRLNDSTRIYTLNVSKEDKQQGYSYIGNAVHIRNEQDPISIYQSAECLSLRGTAIKKLITAENELKVIISSMQ